MTAYPAIETFHKKYGYEYAEVESIQLPLHYATGIEKEIEAMQSTAGLIDLKPFNLLSIEGPEAATFLQGMVSNDIQQIEIGGIQSNLLSDHKGKILYRLEILRLTEQKYIILTDAGEGPYVGGYLDHFHIQEDLELKLLNPDYLRFDLIGPLSEQALGDLGRNKGEISWDYQNHQMISIPCFLGQLPRIVNIAPQTAFVDIANSLLNTPYDLKLVGFEALDHIRIDAGIPRAGVDYTRNNFPQEASLMDHISYQKGCYIGQETHARMYHRGHPNWQLVGIKVPADLGLQSGTELFYLEEKVGTVTSLSDIEKNGIQHGIAFIKHQWVLEKVSLALEAGGEGIIDQFPLTTSLDK